MLLFDVKHQQKDSEAAKSWVASRYTLDEWIINNQTEAVMFPSANASQVLEGKAYPTSNLVLTFADGCIESSKPESPLVQPWDGEVIPPEEIHPEVLAARTKFNAKLTKTWKTEIKPAVERLYIVCRMCDPRLKLFNFPGVEASQRFVARKVFENEYKVSWAPNDLADVNTVAPTARQTGSIEPPAPKKLKMSTVGSFTGFLANMEQLHGAPTEDVDTDDTNCADAAQAEIDTYFSLPVAPMDTDILEWWSKHEARMPNLSRMARQFLAVPACSASVERLFSLAGRICTKDAQKMTTENLSERLWTKANRINN